MYTRPLSLDLPTTIDEAVSILLADLELLDRTRLGSLDNDDLYWINKHVGLQIIRDFRLWSGNELLLNACMKAMDDNDDMEDDDPSMVIIQAMWDKLQKTHVLRVVK